VRLQAGASRAALGAVVRAVVVGAAVFSIAAAAASEAGSVAAAGRPEPAATEAIAQGRVIFDTQCAACHALTPGAAAMAGPSLAGLLGRPTAGDPGFDDSPALRAARAAGEVWTAPRLERSLADPHTMFAGLGMGERGLRDAAGRAALVAHLAGDESPVSTSGAAERSTRDRIHLPPEASGIECHQILHSRQRSPSKRACSTPSSTMRGSGSPGWRGGSAVPVERAQIANSSSDATW
jgi:cytochrome c2